MTAAWRLPLIAKPLGGFQPGLMMGLDELVIDGLAGMPGPEGGQYEVYISKEMDEPAHAIFDVIRLSSAFIKYLWWTSCLFLLRYRASHEAFEDELAINERRPLAEYDDRIRKAHHNFVESRAAVLDRSRDLSLETVDLSAAEIDQIKSLFLRSVAWVIYHETAHLELGHKRSTVENEYEADRYATALISEWPAEEDGGRTSRFGQMTAMLGLMSVQQVEQEYFEEKTHPLVYRRVLDRLDQFDLNENSDEYHYSVLMLRGELMELGVEFEDEPEASSLLESIEYHIAKLEDYVAQKGSSAT